MPILAFMWRAFEVEVGAGLAAGSGDVVELGTSGGDHVGADEESGNIDDVDCVNGKESGTYVGVIAPDPKDTISVSSPGSVGVVLDTWTSGVGTTAASTPSQVVIDTSSMNDSWTLDRRSELAIPA